MVAEAYPSVQPSELVSPEEYLARERVAEARSEYDAGVIVAMAGATWYHSMIAGDIERLIGNQMTGGPCQAASRDQRTRVIECNRYFYPDIVAVCGEPEFEDSELDTLLNPIAVVEVLSKSTAVRDRGEKWLCYQTVPTLQVYALVSQHRPLVEVFRRRADAWEYRAHVGIEASVSFEEIGCELALADIYARVKFGDLDSQIGPSDTGPTNR